MAYLPKSSQGYSRMTVANLRAALAASRFNKSRVMFKEMGIWVAHGEGRFHFPKKEIHDKVMSSNLATVLRPFVRKTTGIFP